MPTDFAPRALLVLAGLAFGASGFLYGYYGTTVWEPICLVAIAFLLAVLLARPVALRGNAAVALAGLIGLWLWSFLSSTWAEASDQAITYANRWLLYAVILALLLVLARGSAARRLLIGATAAGVLAMGTYIVARLLLGQGSDLFLGNRLNGPLDYINGQATYLLIAFWPLVAFAERTRSPVLGGLSVFAGVQLLSMVLLTQSRGALLALVVSMAAILIVVPCRLPRAWTLVAMILGVAIALPSLRDVIDAPSSIPPPDSTLRAAAEASLVGGAVIGAVWVIVRSGAEALVRRRPGSRALLRMIGTAGITLICILGAAVALLPPDKRIDQVRDQYDAFTQLRAVDSSSRLASGGGHRYDYWRIAWDQFKDDPLRGVGAGNYDRTYYLERRTDEDINQAHSIELQTLGETGLVGGIALATFAGAVMVGFWRRARSANAELADAGTAVAAGGTFLVWLVHSSVDWPHLIPGLTGIALCAAATLLPEARPMQLRRGPPWIALAILLSAAATYPVARQAVALSLQSQGRASLQSDPVDALRKASDSLALQDSAQTYYLQAAAYARLGLYGQARAALLSTARSEPHNFVTWGLLGDLATRHGSAAMARRYYGRASALNPRDSSLARLAGRQAVQR